MKIPVAGQQADCLLYLAAAGNNETQNLATSLGLFGYEVSIFNTQESLLAAIDAKAPHALLLDCDASDFTLENIKLRYGDIASGLPVIIISGDDNFDKRLMAVRAGVDGYFIKPVDVAALSDRIDNKVTRHDIRGYRILTVDDDEMLSTFYEAVLNIVGMHVKALTDPATILEEIARFQPELILLDMYMPVCTGAELAKLIRQNNRYLDIPIVFLSSEENIDRQIDTMEIGADNFLTKPIDPKNLISVVTSRAERYRALRRKEKP